MSDQEWLTTYDAIEIVHKKGYGNFTMATMRNWIRRYSIGKKVGGRYFVNRKELMKLVGDFREELENDEKALKPTRTDSKAKQKVTLKFKGKKA